MISPGAGTQCLYMSHVEAVRQANPQIELTLSCDDLSADGESVQYCISQNFRDLKVSLIAAKTGVRNVHE